jgi:hypothetical protein
MVILLTACIDTNSCVNTKRTNIQDRINDYYFNIKSLLENTQLDIVFVENSKHDIGIISEFIGNERVEIIQFDGNNFNRHLGKGHGEWKIINYAIENSTKLKEVDYIIKLTGRYSIDISIFSDMMENDYVFYEKETKLLERWAFTGFFKIPKSFWTDKISNSFISDDFGCYIENVMAHNLSLNNSNITYIKDIGLKGISGTHNQDLSELI